MALLFAAPTSAQDDDALRGWPRIVEAVGASITMYQPQIDSWEDNTFEARAAVSVVPSAGAEPIFGAIWLSGYFETDSDTRMVQFFDITIPAVKFPNASEEHQQKLIDILEQEMATWDHEMSLDRILPTLDLAERDAQKEADLQHTPPEIIIKYTPAVLIIIDGDPILEEIEGSSLERVVNTPYVIVEHKKDFYLATDTTWYTADDIKGPWQTTSKLPKDVAKIDEQLKEQQEDQGTAAEEDEGSDPRIPAIVVSTVPAELIFIDGKPNLEPVEGNDILKVGNTDSDVIFDIGDQSYYVLLSGRWYRSKNLDRGPWQWVANTDVPGSFTGIPADSDIGYLRTSVAGTDEAREAVLEQSVPQTAAVKKGPADSKVEYDGEPKFEPVENTEMKYAVNTPSAVILAEGQYYWCEQGVWYVGPSATGPWSVCEKVPDVIYTIPPSNPNYNVTYVTVYQATPEVVYVGYTPGYTGSYVSHSCVVYGTGWYYRPWYSPHYYYPRPSTWGFHVRWNPWYGWGYGLSYTTGPFRFTVGWGGWGGYPRYGGWWGPSWYRPYPAPYRHGYRAGYYAGYRHGYHHGNRPSHYGGGKTGNINNNIYNRPSNRDRVVNTHDRAGTGQRPAAARDKSNNLYTDRQGNVYRRNDNGSWEQRQPGGWSPTPGAPSAGDRSRPSTLGRQLARQPAPGPRQAIDSSFNPAVDETIDTTVNSSIDSAINQALDRYATLDPAIHSPLHRRQHPQP